MNPNKAYEIKKSIEEKTLQKYLIRNRIKIGRLIKELRKARGWRQSDFAEISNVKQSQLSKIEKGKYYMRLDMFLEILMTLNIHPQIFFERLEEE